MTALQLAWWQVSLSMSNSQAAEALYMSRRHFIRLRRGLVVMPGNLGLLCAAVAAGVQPWAADPPAQPPAQALGGPDLSFQLMRARARARRKAQRQN